MGGETDVRGAPASASPSCSQVYPRVGGETRLQWSSGTLAMTIPAWAGTTCCRNWPIPKVGSIPAWAGKPDYLVRACGLTTIQGLSPRGRGNRRLPSELTRLVDQVYPRVGGETDLSLRRNVSSLAWVYPRVGGETDLAELRWIELQRRTGLSPRGRGNLPSTRTGLSAIVHGVYPRVGGETDHRVAVGRGWQQGLSPRGRGNHRVYLEHDGYRFLGLSPRGRGNLQLHRPSGRQSYGSIPAWAGKPQQCPYD